MWSREAEQLGSTALSLLSCRYLGHWTQISGHDGEGVGNLENLSSIFSGHSGYLAHRPFEVCSNLMDHLLL